uniref:Distal membrane-arm assembly complex protein 1-like domain-containing protein n=1 Tax=Hyaloperonospora arabidopsidis (strain Emoy2) TaxID=559515 RepID=M4BQY0_HYAAE
MAAEKSEIDCLGCRLTGSITLLGVGGYFFNERTKVPRQDLKQRRWLLASVGAFATAGVWRAMSHLFETPQGLADGDDDSSSKSHSTYTP